MRHLHRSDEALLMGIVRVYCGCPKPTNDEERLAFRCVCGAAGVLDPTVEERLGKLRAEFAETRRRRGNVVGRRS